MHPIERLRYVARAGPVDHAVLVRETAGALAALGDDDPIGLVTACRRLLDRHPTSAPLWWLGARVLTAADPLRAAWQAADELERDPTPRAVAAALPDDALLTVVGWPELTASALPRRGDVEVLVVDAGGPGAGFSRRLGASDVAASDVPDRGVGPAAAAADLVLLEAAAMGPDGFVAPVGARAAAAVARHAGVPVWLVVGRGRALPGPMWRSLLARLDDDEPWEADEEVVPLDLVDRVVGPDGAAPAADAARRVDCGVAPELLRDVRGGR